MFKKICLIGFIAAALSFAQEETETYIRNICDTLPNSATPLVELKMAYVGELAVSYRYSQYRNETRQEGYVHDNPF